MRDGVSLEMCESMYEDAVARIRSEAPFPRRVLDLGAHYGALTLYAAVRGAVVLAVDPVHAPRILENARINRCQERVMVLPFAADVRDGEEVHVYQRGGNDGMCGLYYDKGDTDNHYIRRTVSGTTVARLLPDPDYIKIDIEGHEHVLLNDPAWLELFGRARTVDFEIHDIRGEGHTPAGRDPVEALLSLGFTRTVIDSRHLLFRKEKP